MIDYCYVNLTDKAAEGERTFWDLFSAEVCYINGLNMQLPRYNVYIKSFLDYKYSAGLGY